MKKIYSIAAIGLVAATMLATGCKKENSTVTLRARIDNSRDAKVYVEDNLTCWHNGDLVRVNNETCTTSAALDVEALIEVSESNEAPYRAIYPDGIVEESDISGTDAVSVTLPSVQEYRVDSEGDQFVEMPMGAYATGRSLVFRNLCSLLKVELSSNVNFFLDHITVTSSIAPLSGAGEARIATDGQQKIVMSPSGVSHEVSLDFVAAGSVYVSSGNTYVYYIVVPEIQQTSDITIKVYDNVGREFSITKTGRTLGVNQVAKIPLLVTQMTVVEDLADDELYGVFSVGNGLKVHFSHGNLQYNITTQTWQFATNQYDYIGESNINGNVRDLFSWGTNNATATSTGSTFVEWGNNITDATYGSNIWKTLSQSQWEYLMNNRESRVDGSPLWGLGTVAGYRGLILLPDGWITPTGLRFVPRWRIDDAEPDEAWYTNRYNTSQWTQMEENGAVFLPCAGFLYEDYGNISYFDYYFVFSYWGYVSPSSPTPYLMTFNPVYDSYYSNNFFSYPLYGEDDWQAASVRLVRFLNTNAGKGGKR